MQEHEARFTLVRRSQLKYSPLDLTLYLEDSKRISGFQGLAM